MKIRSSGQNQAKASITPNTAAEAPRIGVPEKNIERRAPVTPLAKYRVTNDRVPSSASTRGPKK
ncbi:MAG: hypothetical protein ABS52_13735 [Gemmatimonadetes bacterium SCN 70-22]|nr:MAG: hypothetical protein ABS52_13735 [Gemmatimonadetes bacterium SCN 70-22]